MINEVWEGDCLKLLPKLPDALADFILTDPPYITNYRSRDGRRVPNDKNDAWLKVFLRFVEAHYLAARRIYSHDVLASLIESIVIRASWN